MEKEYIPNISLEEYEKLNDVEKREYYERTVDDYLEKQGISKEKYDKELESYGFSEKEGYYRDAFAGIPDPEMYSPRLSPEGRDNARGFIEWQRDQEREERESKVAFRKYNTERNLYIKESGITDKQYQEQCEKGQLKSNGYNRSEYEHPELVPSSERFNPWLSQEAKEQIREINKDKIKEQEKQREQEKEKREQDKEKRQQERKEEIKKYAKEKNKYCRDNNISFKEYDRNVAIGGNLMPSSEQYNPDRSKEEREDIANRDIWKGREAEKAAYEKEVADYLKETGMSKKDYTYQCTHAESPRDYPGSEHKNLNHYHIRDEIKNRDMVAEREFEKQYQKEHKDDKFKDDGERQTVLKQKISDRIDYVYDKENERYEQEKEQWCRENNVSYREYEFLRSQEPDSVPYPERLEPERSVSEKEYIQDRGDNVWEKEDKAAYEKEVSDYLRETGMSREDYTYQCINSKNPNELPVPERSNVAHNLDSKIQLRKKDPEIEKEFEKKYQQEHKNDRFNDDKERLQALKDKSKERDIFVKEKEQEREQERYNKDYDKYTQEKEKYCRENNISLKEYDRNVEIGNFLTPSAEQYNPDISKEKQDFARENNVWEKLHGDRAEIAKNEYQRGVDDYLKKTGMSREDYNYQCANSRGPNDLPKPEQKNANHWLNRHFEQRNLRDEIKFEKQYQKEHKDDRFNDDKERQEALKEKIKERDQYLKDREQSREKSPIKSIKKRFDGVRDNIQNRIQDFQKQREEREAKAQQRMEEKRAERRYEKDVKAFCKENNMSRAEYNHFRLVPGVQDHLTPEFNSPHNPELQRAEMFNRYCADLNRDYEDSKIPNSTISHEKCIREMDKVYEKQVTEYCRENNMERTEYNSLAREHPELCPPEQVNRQQPSQVRESLIQREEQRIDKEVKESERKFAERSETNNTGQSKDKTQEIYHNLYERGVEKYCNEHNIENRDDYNNHIANLEREGKALPEHEALNPDRTLEERQEIIEANREESKTHEEPTRELTHERGDTPEILGETCPSR